VTLASGQTLKAKLIIGADGRTSGTATRAGIKRTGWATAKPQSFARWGTKTPRRNHAPVLYALGACYCCYTTLFDCLVRNRCPRCEITAMDDADFLNALRPAFGDFWVNLH
jgi:2-octaprenyl-6-methoxyphenol hydroxylase